MTAEKRNIIFMVAVKIPGWESRSAPYEYAIDAWTQWCRKHDVELVVLSELLYPHDVMKITWQRYHFFRLYPEAFGKMAMIDADTIPHPELPNFFELIDDEIGVVPADGDFDWISRSMENFHHVFGEEYPLFNVFDYVNAGFMVMSSRFKIVFEKMLEFYWNNARDLKTKYYAYGVGSDQGPFNFILRKYCKPSDIKYLSYQYCMSDMMRKSLFNNDVYLHFPGLYQFNAIPGNAKYGEVGIENNPTLFLMKKTYQNLYGTANIQ